MEEIFRVSRLTSDTPQEAQDKLKKALRAVPGVRSVSLRPVTHEFAIQNEGALRSAVLDAAAEAGFRVRNNTGS